MKTRNQTVSFLMKRFREVGIQPATRHGQNFLIDLNLVELLVRSADIGPDDVILEVGTGTGSLTAMMAEKAAAVVTVEIDRQMFQLAREELDGFDNVHQLCMDALKNKNQFSPALLEEVKRHVEAAPGRRLKLAANLPYNIATPIVSNLLLTEIKPYSMTVTIQKELGDRMTCSPGTKDYGALSVWIQSQCHAEIVRIMPPSVFWPRPKVHSAIIHIRRDEELAARIPDLQFFHEFTRSMFFHRRKFLRSVMLAAFKNRLGKPEVDAIMQQHQLDADSRSEQLNVEQMIALGETCRTTLAELEK